MAEKKTAKPVKRKIKRKRVTLTLSAPHAEAVSLMGDFNQWNQKVHPMKRERDGTWKKIIVVQPGRYEYRFLVDGEWWNDPANDQTCSNCFGTVNNVLEVSG
ncbi:MAG: glycogen-binding domain-containing protein [Deltaproteobacteria bacterium]|nr:glycogen-binding domain-containing protein [Deltaproteobacteria bacterium]